MTERKDLETMIEIVSLAIVRQETEEAFFRRSGCSSTCGTACSLFTEIADEIASYVEYLKGKRDKLIIELNDLKNTKTHVKK